ncbi:MAG TPA: LysR substrate-binding domain-containing protein, partial [Burkholderiaceae bacterium]|nr:LysR substrate-binding domain-containing protein [Burkholderiaceae bacterium]
LTYSYLATPRLWQLTDAAGQVHDVRVSGSLHVNSGEMLTAAAVAGLGIVLEPDFIVGPALAAGRLVRLLPDYEAPRGDIWAVYPSRRHLSLKVRLFVDHIAGLFTGLALPTPARAHSKRRASKIRGP